MNKAQYKKLQRMQLWIDELQNYSLIDDETLSELEIEHFLETFWDTHESFIMEVALDAMRYEEPDCEAVNWCRDEEALMLRALECDAIYTGEYTSQSTVREFIYSLDKEELEKFFRFTFDS